MTRRAGIDFSSRWFDEFVSEYPVNGNVLTGGANGHISWQPPTSTASFDNIIVASDYATLQLAVTASCDAGKTLLLNRSFDVGASIPLETDGSTIIGIGENVVTLTATAGLTAGVFDIRVDGVSLGGFKIDGDNQANCVGLSIGSVPGTSVGTAKRGTLRDIEIENCAQAIRFGDDVDYWSCQNIRMMDGNVRCIYIDVTAGGLYDNGHVYFTDCEMSATLTCLERVAVGSTFHRLDFRGCDFHDGHSNNYMVDTSTIHECRFYGCTFEAGDGLNQGPDDAMLYLNSYASGCWGCSFSFKDNTAGYDGVRAHTDYDPYPFYSCLMENSVAGQHVEIIGTGATAVLTGLQSTYRYNCAGTAATNAVDLYDLVD